MALTDKVKKIIKDIGKIDGEIKEHFTLEEYGFNSMELIELIARLEELVDEPLDDDPIFGKFIYEISIQEIIELVKKKC